VTRMLFDIVGVVKNATEFATLSFIDDGITGVFAGIEQDLLCFTPPDYVEKIGSISGLVSFFDLVLVLVVVYIRDNTDVFEKAYDKLVKRRLCLSQVEDQMSNEKDDKVSVNDEANDLTNENVAKDSATWVKSTRIQACMVLVVVANAFCLLIFVAKFFFDLQALELESEDGFKAYEYVTYEDSSRWIRGVLFISDTLAACDLFDYGRFDVRFDE